MNVFAVPHAIMFAAVALTYAAALGLWFWYAVVIEKKFAAPLPPPPLGSFGHYSGAATEVVVILTAAIHEQVHLDGVEGKQWSVDTLELAHGTLLDIQYAQRQAQLFEQFLSGKIRASALMAGFIALDEEFGT